MYRVNKLRSPGASEEQAAGGAREGVDVVLSGCRCDVSCILYLVQVVAPPDSLAGTLGKILSLFPLPHGKRKRNLLRDVVFEQDFGMQGRGMSLPS